jgi:hypothetical protein
MGFWGSLKDAFGFGEGSSEQTQYQDIEITPTTPQRAGAWASAQTLLSSSPRETIGIGGIMPSDPSAYEIAESSSSGFWGSLWDSVKSAGAKAKETISGIYEEAKEVAPVATSLYKTIQEIKKPLDTSSLVLRQSPSQAPTSQDLTLFTPYPRADSGAKPASISIEGAEPAPSPAVITTGNGKGPSMPLILIAGAAALLFLTAKRR